MRTLLLDRTGWDLVLDAQGNIAVASNPYSQAQDAASAIRTFQGECYYDTSKGVPYWNRAQPTAVGQILGQAPPISYMKAVFVSAALTVPGVTAARAFLRAITKRVVSGQIQITNKEGGTFAANF